MILCIHAVYILVEIKIEVESRLYCIYIRQRLYHIPSTFGKHTFLYKKLFWGGIQKCSLNPY